MSGYHLLIEEKIKPIKEIVNNTVVNTIVLDVKTDNGHLMYDSKIDSVAELKNERIKYDSTTLQELQNELDIYLVGRVVAFQDPIFSRKYIESAIIDSKTNSPYSQNGQYFLDPSEKKRYGQCGGQKQTVNTLKKSNAKSKNNGECPKEIQQKGQIKTAI